LAYPDLKSIGRAILPSHSPFYRPLKETEPLNTWKRCIRCPDVPSANIEQLRGEIEVARDEPGYGPGSDQERMTGLQHLRKRKARRRRQEKSPLIRRSLTGALKWSPLMIRRKRSCYLESQEKLPRENRRCLEKVGHHRLRKLELGRTNWSQGQGGNSRTWREFPQTLETEAIQDERSRALERHSKQHVRKLHHKRIWTMPMRFLSMQTCASPIP